MSSGVVVGTYAQRIVSGDKIHFGDREQSYTKALFKGINILWENIVWGLGAIL